MSRSEPDPEALAYARYWEPVIAAPARRLLDRITITPADYLDIGAGTGSLPLAAADLWPRARIVGLDASGGMLSVARHRVSTERETDDRSRFAWIAADAARMPLPDASFDAVTSSFMLQLVDDRATVLAEVLRVLRPGGTFALVTWIAGELSVAADEIFDDVVTSLGIVEPAADLRTSRSADLRDVDEARAELEAAGFSEVTVGNDEVRLTWSRDGYLDFKRSYDEYDLFESLQAPDRTSLCEALMARCSKLPDAAFSVRGPVVWATGTRPARS